MTSDGVDGTAAELGPGARSGDRAPGSAFIKHDDERLAQRYIGPRYSHVPAGAAPNTSRRERQVAAALRDCTDFVTANLILGTASGRADGQARAMGCR